MKKFLAISTILILTLTAVGCGKKDEADINDSGQVDTTIETTVADENAEPTEATSDEISTTDEAPVAKKPVGVKPISDEKILFADDIKEIAVAKDMERLADKMTFPTYISTLGEFETKEDFLALDTEDIFTADLIEAVTSTNTAKIQDLGADMFVIGDTESLLYLACSKVDDGYYVISINN